MNKSQKKENLIVASIIILILIITGLVFAFCPPIAFFNKEIYVTSTTRDLDLCGSPSDWPMYFIQFFKNLKTLHLYAPAESDLQYIPDTRTLKGVSISFADIKDPSGVPAFGRVETLHFLGSEFNFDGFSSNSVSDLSFSCCNIKNFDKRGGFALLDTLSFTNCFFDKEDYSYNETYDRTSNEVIKNTDAFSTLSSIKHLVFDHMIFEDVSGFLLMKDLEDISAPEYAFSPDDVEKLEVAGIKVMKP